MPPNLRHENEWELVVKGTGEEEACSKTGATNLFCKGPDGKCFRFGRPSGLCCSDSALP